MENEHIHEHIHEHDMTTAAGRFREAMDSQSPDNIFGLFLCEDGQIEIMAMQRVVRVDAATARQMGNALVSLANEADKDTQ